MADKQLTSQEEEKATILAAVIEGRITNEQAAKQLGLSIRQVQRTKDKPTNYFNNSQA